MSGRHYDEPEAGEWVQPRRKGYRLRCCDCGLTHIFNFRLARYGAGRKVQFQVFRDNRATAAIRARAKRKANR